MGRLVSDFLTTSFTDYINDEFTSNMEDDLDAISNGSKSKKEVLDLFWSPLEKEVTTKWEKVRLIDSSDANIFAAELPDAVNVLPKNSNGDLTFSRTV